ncbi:MAG: MBL fold metallo-hydrolase [Salinimicrobium sp.]
MRYIASIFLFSLLFVGCKEKSEGAEPIEPEQEMETGQVELEAETPEASGIKIHPISHATAVITWDDTNIYLDPVGGASAFEGQKDPDLIFITDIHQDHLDLNTLKAMNLDGVKIVVPKAVQEELPNSLASHLEVMNNGETITLNGFSIQAIPMYNLREEAKQFHTKGRGNGYVIEKDGKRLYIAGDTEDIPEMRNLENIDIALVPMNLPYTMPVTAAADAVIEFAPKTVYPYHYRGQNGMADVQKFKQLVNEANKDIKVVLEDWYPNETKKQ